MLRLGILMNSKNISAMKRRGREPGTSSFGRYCVYGIGTHPQNEKEKEKLNRSTEAVWVVAVSSGEKGHPEIIDLPASSSLGTNHPAYSLGLLNLVEHQLRTIPSVQLPLDRKDHLLRRSNKRGIIVCSGIQDTYDLPPDLVSVHFSRLTAMPCPPRVD